MPEEIKGLFADYARFPTCCITLEGTQQGCSNIFNAILSPQSAQICFLYHQLYSVEEGISNACRTPAILPQPQLAPAEAVRL